MFSGEEVAAHLQRSRGTSAVQLGIHGRNVAVACRLSERGLAAKSPFRKTGGGGVSPGVGGGCILTGECFYIST